MIWFKGDFLGIMNLGSLFQNQPGFGTGSATSGSKFKFLNRFYFVKNQRGGIN
jgi:hypothetical protein